MTRKIILIAALILLFGAGTALLVIPHDVNLMVNGQSRSLRTNALTVAGALRQANLQVNPDDRLDPPASTWIKAGAVICLDQAQTVTLIAFPSGETVTLQSASLRPADWLAKAGWSIGAQDRLTLNGLPVDQNQDLPYQGSLLLQVHRAVVVTLRENGQVATLQSSADTLGEALWESGITLTAADAISMPLETPLQTALDVELKRAQPVKILVDNREITTASSADTVAAALSDAGVSLQGLDYSRPAEQDILPVDATIRVVRVREEIVLNQKSIPYKSSYQQDPNTELDKRSVVTPGEYGVKVSRERIRYEDDVEVSRVEDTQWVAKEPKDQVLGYGTLPVVKSIDTPSGTLEYWRAVNVWATSYSPCRLGIPNYCSTGTSSGLTVRQGIVAVTRAWYSWMVGQRVYIPGYGIAVIADVGGGIPGRYWVDLAYGDAEYIPWSQSVTMYFLTPVPQNIPWILP